ncbi:MAG: 30S ribosomal protein S17 [Patescibacteria group bacterium]
MRKLQGTIVSDKMRKTRIVSVDRLVKHPRYEKRYNVTQRFKAHDEKEEYKTGDVVVIKEIRPISKDKRWEIIKLVKRAEIPNTLEPNS